ncbi:MAG: NifB/NifX family molybdenum-iron cluster-binding protein [Candidatus Aenigmarchaeota archaeon]|nr:NifB/NifX family molybdenum-iron cluster-binding protein [Candidatus Aenigmarchaeota archaeon]
MSSMVAEHFGRCETYTFLDEAGEVTGILENGSEHMGGVGLPPEFLKKNGAEVLLCGGVGPRAITLCNELGIAVYVSDARTVQEIFELWKAGKIKRAGADDACEEHKL